MTSSFPSIHFSADEIATGTLRPESLQAALAAFTANGCLLIDNAFSPALIAEMNRAFAARYSRYLRGGEHDDALTLSRGRYQVSLLVEPPFDSPTLYGHPLLLQILKSLLGENCRLDSFGAALSIPGADEQRLHRDAPGLFDDHGVNSSLPPYAVTLYAPLVDLNEITGTTRMWPGSHRATHRDFDDTDAHADPLCAAGAAILMDYRTQHKGLANRSPNMRPILYLVYRRPWWSDHLNFSSQPRLTLTFTAREMIPKSCRSLFPPPNYEPDPLPPPSKVRRASVWKARWQRAYRGVQQRLGAVPGVRPAYRKLRKLLAQPLR